MSPGKCCNFYEDGVCVEDCSDETVADGGECLTQCPSGKYNVSGVCGKLY